MTICDPVLETLAVEDSVLHDRVVEALIATGGTCAVAVVGYRGISPVQLAAAAQSHTMVRSAVAARLDCPGVVLETLAQDSSDQTRCAVARNTATPADVLVQLAADADRWVRFAAYNNPASPEQARVAAALLSSPEELQSRLSLPVEEDPQTPPEELRRIALGALSRRQDYRSRARLARNPSLPNDLLPRLVEVASTKEEWGALWARLGSTWPSTLAFESPKTPAWVRDVLTAAGHPVSMLHVGIKKTRVTTSSVDAVFQLIQSELLIRALWRELALVGAVELVYWNDSVEGDHFFPQTPTLVLIDDHSPAEKIVGGHSTTREWIKTENVLTLEGLSALVGNQWENWEENVSDFSSDELALFSLSAACLVAQSSSDERVTLTAKGQDALFRLGEEDLVYIDIEDMETIVHLHDSALPHIGYADTSDEQKRCLVSVLRDSRSDLRMARWGISDHFLKCIALHPDTPEDVRSELAADENLGVREAASAGRLGAQAGIYKAQQADPGIS